MCDPIFSSGMADRLGRLFGREQDRATGLRAVELGRLTRAQFDDAWTERERTSRPLGEILSARGSIPLAEFEELAESMDRQDYSTLKLAGAAALPPEVSPLLQDPARRVAEFVLVERLGCGGAGEVWKAWDRRLGRWSALKIPLALPEKGDALDRFTREAVVAARLSHPNIVSIHRVTEENGLPCIVMQYVEGRTLQQEPPPLRGAAEAVREAALAVHYAHEQGVIHRDLKPANIMVGRDGRVLVLDFGLARLSESGRGLSEQGVLSGTAAYMSPEQALGDPRGLSRTVDIYALGATLYHLATGHPPFGGASLAETVHRVIHDDPTRPGDLCRETPRDLETIILKAMDKDPARRYTTALEFADDLGRFLACEPIRARPVSPLEEGVRRLGRHPRTAVFVALVFTLSAAGLLAGRGTARREREASLATIRETARVSLQAALELRRAGANARMTEFLPRLETAYRQAIERAPDLAEVDYLMGRFHRAILDDGPALEFQNKALSKDPHFAPALYERAILASKNYGRGLRRAYGIETALAPGPVTAEVARRVDPPSLEEFGGRREDLVRMRNAIVADCLGLERALGGITEANATAARGILAFHRGAVAEAKILLEAAVRKDPLMEEAWETLALASLSPLNQGTPVEALERAWADAELVYDEGLARDRGYQPHWLGRASLRTARANLHWDTGRDPAADFSGAEADFAEAIRLQPSADVFIRRSALFSSKGSFNGRQGRDPMSAWKNGDDDLQRAVHLDPTSVVAWSRLAYNCRARAEYRLERGESPLEECDRAEEYIIRALSLDPNDGSAWMNRGAMQTCRGMDRAARSEDPIPDFDRAEHAYNEALRFDKAIRGPWERRGYLRLQRARWQAAHGQDSAPALRGAEEDLTRCIELSERFTMAWLARAMVHRASGSLDAAKADLLRVVRFNPSYPEAWIELGHLHLAQALASGGKEAAAQALADFERGVALDPTLNRSAVKDGRARALSLSK
ncbi:MAG TPA: protein kinase [Planctomycetota bacterium]|nr:protein kinase [Planctomycetota bacterium]